MDKDMPSSAGGKEVQPPRVENSWNKPLPWVEPRHGKETVTKESPKKSLHNKESVTSTLGEDISTIMSILQTDKALQWVEPQSIITALSIAARWIFHL
ncbi:hypothetical protein EVAR_65194_1 [Eumeta japonica]|uniref:Uncharacterized protein n=1 Tax=Eumeta variegata TaxID=151549 RepID=A0A4C1ZK72_EUMVA|nr:hypothetical protein EVAR_65194_1 [Eumeta japonica]